jgi:hypothetical protein
VNGYVQRAVGIIGLFLLQFSINANSILAQEIKLTASDADSEDLFGFSIDINGDTLVVGAHFDEEYGFQTGSAYVFRRSHGGWFQQTKLGFGSTGALFGRSVAVAGNTIVVGAPYISDPGNPSGISTGGALVYIRESETWSLQARLAASDGVTGDEVGTSVAISADGNTVIVGARQGISDKPGAVYVFIRNGSEWSEQAKLTANDGVIGDRFGRSVAIRCWCTERPPAGRICLHISTKWYNLERASQAHCQRRGKLRIFWPINWIKRGHLSSRRATV